jgi:hypothetical protein
MKRREFITLLGGGSRRAPQQRAKRAAIGLLGHARVALLGERGSGASESASSQFV